MGSKISGEKGTTPYRLNREIEEKGKKLVAMGFHNTMSDLVEYATAQHVLFLEQKLAESRRKK